MVLGLVAHVDAGKTTLSEAMLYVTGKIRTLGRVDHGDSTLDTDEQERERGITIFSKQARMAIGGRDVTLLDTPGHVDFSAETERALGVMDYAVLVISATDGVQAHTRTLWKLLAHYGVPAFLFINKMDLPGADRARLMKELREKLSDGCVDFTNGVGESSCEELALCSEKLLEAYMNKDSLSAEQIAEAVAAREVFPCFFGSALHLQGIKEFLLGLFLYTKEKTYPSDFAARVYQIGRDKVGARLTYLKVTGGQMRVKDVIEYAGAEEKIEQIRLYTADRYETRDAVSSGILCAVTGLTKTEAGMGLGAEQEARTAVLEPVMTYEVILPANVSPLMMSTKLRELSEEDPTLQIIWDETLQQISIRMMGQVQLEVLTREIFDRFGISVRFGPGRVVYKETVAEPVEGVGHFEPLRHYAEVHLLLEPAERGTGIEVVSACSTDVLSANWQHLIETHITECIHPGVLTGGELTDVRITILSGRAHEKHTEGGDFRQATYRAIRQGLKRGKCVLLEPYARFTVTVSASQIGRAMTDLLNRGASFSSPESAQRGGGGEDVSLTGRGPLSSLQSYGRDVQIYTHGLGIFSLEPDGYDVCRSSKDVIEAQGYDSEADLAHPTSSIFCSHGSGFVVPWDEVERYMHLPYAYRPGEETRGDPADGIYYETAGQTFVSDQSRPARGSWEKSVAAMSETKLDAELSEIYARTFHMNADEEREDARRREEQKRRRQERQQAQTKVKHDKAGNPIYPKKKAQEEYLIVDGYNVIFTTEELNDLAKVNVDAARDRLLDWLHNYQGYKKCRLLLVFDAYRVKDNAGSVFVYDGRTKKYADGSAKVTQKKERPGLDTLDGVIVVYTKQDETADAFIERTAHDLADKYRLIVASSDNLEQITVLTMGAMRMSSRELIEELSAADQAMREQYHIKEE